MIIVYNIFRVLYEAAVSIAAYGNAKAKKWVDGRKNWQKELQSNWQVKPGNFVVWMHCASLGEFEQGRPLIEQLKKQIPGSKILLTFFSPSGYEVRKNYEGADYVMYLPMDSKQNANTFLDLVKPQLAVFIKYEFWHYYLQALNRAGIKTILVSGIFRSSQPFFQWWGSFHRNMLRSFSHLFVQDQSSKELLHKIELAGNVTVTGDTRFDRVLDTAQQWKPIDTVEQFIGNKKIMVAGSTWKEDEDLLAQWFSKNKNEWQIIIAPHEIKQENLERLSNLFPGSVFFSNTGNPSQQLSSYDCMIIDNIGLLSKLYRYATVCYVGGGFNKSGHHNMLEAAVYGKAIITGPYFQKFKESRDLKKLGSSFTIEKAEHLTQVLEKINTSVAGTIAEEYVKDHSGATARVVQWIQENLLLTSA